MHQLKAALQALVREVCQAFGNMNMPMRNWMRIVRTDAQTFSFPVELRPNIAALLIGVFQISDKLESLKQLASAVDSDPKLSAIIAVDAAGQPILDVAAKQNWLLNFLAAPFLTDYFTAKKEIVYDQEVVDAALKRLLTKLETPATHFISLSPLLNLRLAADSLEVTPGLRLRRLAPEELEEWANPPGLPVLATPISFHDLLGLECAIEVKMEAQAGEQFELDTIRDLPARLVNVLRLFTDRNIYILFTQQESQEASRPLLRQAVQLWTLSLRLQGEAATIDEMDGKQLIELWHRLEISPNVRRIELAFKRWSATAERLSDEDKIIDYWVALESLFTSDSSQEVSFRASLRIAAFLGETPDERQRIYSDMRQSYDWRSAIVHGGMTNPKKMKELNKKGTLPEITKVTRSYLRTALLRLIEMDEGFDPQRIELQLLSR